MAHWPSISMLRLRGAIVLFVLANGSFLIFHGMVDTPGLLVVALLLGLFAIASWLLLLTRRPIWSLLWRFELSSSIVLFLISNSLLWLVRPQAASSTRMILALVTYMIIAPLGWALLFAKIAKKLQWSPRTCYLVPSVLGFIAMGIIFLFNYSTANLLLPICILSGWLCKNLVHPETPWHYLGEPEPPITLSLTPKP